MAIRFERAQDQEMFDSLIADAKAIDDVEDRGIFCYSATRANNVRGVNDIFETLDKLSHLKGRTPGPIDGLITARDMEDIFFPALTLRLPQLQTQIVHAMNNLQALKREGTVGGPYLGANTAGAVTNGSLLNVMTQALLRTAMLRVVDGE